MVPVTTEVLADRDTPVSVFEKVAGEAGWTTVPVM